MSEDAFTPAPRPCWIDGGAEQGTATIAVTHPDDDTEVAEVAVPDAEQVRRAVQAATGFAAAAPEQRAGTLDRLALGIAGRAEEIVETITAEAGKPWSWAEREVSLAVDAVRAAAGAARELAVPVSRVDAAGTPGVVSVTRRSPGCPVAVACPAGEPFGVAVAGVAAAVAAGVGVVVLPSPVTPLSASLLGELLADADVRGFSVLPGHEVPDGLTVTAPGFGFCTAVLGADWANESDVERAAAAIARHGVACGGQSPLAVRQVLVPAELIERFGDALRDAVGALPAGSPHDPLVDVGPLVDAAAAERVAGWVEKAVAGGATVLCGGGRDGARVTPAVLRTDAVPDVAGPVLTLSTVESSEPLGDSAAVFSHDGGWALELAGRLGVPVAVGDVPGAHPERPEFAARTLSGPGAVPALVAACTVPQVTVFPALRP